MKFPGQMFDHMVKNTSVDNYYNGIKLRSLSDNEIEDRAQDELDLTNDNDLRDWLEDVIYDEQIPSAVKARIFGISTEVEE